MKNLRPSSTTSLPSIRITREKTPIKSNELGFAHNGLFITNGDNTIHTTTENPVNNVRKKYVSQDSSNHSNKPNNSIEKKHRIPSPKIHMLNMNFQSTDKLPKQTPKSNSGLNEPYESKNNLKTKPTWTEMKKKPTGMFTIKGKEINLADQFRLAQERHRNNPTLNNQRHELHLQPSNTTVTSNSNLNQRQKSRKQEKGKEDDSQYSISRWETERSSVVQKPVEEESSNLELSEASKKFLSTIKKTKE